MNSPLFVCILSPFFDEFFNITILYFHSKNVFYFIYIYTDISFMSIFPSLPYVIPLFILSVVPNKNDYQRIYTTKSSEIFVLKISLHNIIMVN